MPKLVVPLLEPPLVLVPLPQPVSPPKPPSAPVLLPQPVLPLELPLVLLLSSALLQCA